MRGSMRKKSVSRVPVEVSTHHLFCALRHFACNIGDDTEIYMALYDAKTGKYYRYLKCLLLLHSHVVEGISPIILLPFKVAANVTPDGASNAYAHSLKCNIAGTFQGLYRCDFKFLIIVSVNECLPE